MNKPVAVIDYSVDGLSGDLIRSWLKVPSYTVKAVEGKPFPLISLYEISAVIHSGSSLSILADTCFIEDAIDFVRRSAEVGIPQMGICYGHQLLARAIVGIDAVARCSSIEMGWMDVDFLSSWPVDGFSGSNAVLQSHYDCVIKIPEGSVITATNSHTEIQAFVNRDMKLFGVQFHPEFDREKGNEFFAENADLFRKNNIDLKSILVSGPGFRTGEVVFNHFFNTFRQES